MICSWRWFIHPATAISTNRNGSRTLGISLAYYAMLKARGDEPAGFKTDPVFGPYGLTAGSPHPLKMANTRGNASLWREAALGCYARNGAPTPLGVNSLRLSVEGRAFG